MRIKRLGTDLLTVAVVVLVLSLVVYPEPSFQAATSGMKIFWDIVFPSLLPFFVLSEIMLGLGVVHFIGVLFEPLMRPLFGVPGEGAFALSMGLAAGYPMDAVITGRFRRQGMCTRAEGERLLAFTNTADPLFMFGAVAVGMFGMPTLGATLAAAHYLSAFSVGILFKFWRRQDSESRPRSARAGSGVNILVRALGAMTRAREEDGRSFGRLLGDAVNDSIKTLLMIGGFIMVFSVLVAMFEVTGATPLITAPIGVVLRLLHLDVHLVGAALQGFFEIDLGTLAASKAAAPFVQKVIMASAVIAWSGLSVHGQVASVVADTDISMRPYFLARFIHAVLAGAYTLVLLGPAAPAVAAAVQLTPAAGAAGAAGTGGLLPFWQHLELSLTRALVIPALMALAGFLYFLPRTMRVTWFRINR